MDDAAPQRSTGGFIPAASDDAPTASSSPASRSEHLVRIEDKVSRVEDKYARTEGLLGRIEDKFSRSEELLARLDGKFEGANAKAGDLARASDVAALRGEVRELGERPTGGVGFGTILTTALLSALLTAILMVAVQRYRIEEPLVRHLDPYFAPKAEQSAPAGQPPQSQPK